jgi:hypothetical protein
MVTRKKTKAKHTPHVFEDRLQRFGRHKIKRVKLVRRPMDSRALQLASKALDVKPMHHDDWLHLFIELELEAPDGSKDWITMEKIPYLEIRTDIAPTYDNKHETSYIDVDQMRDASLGRDLTVRDALLATEKNFISKGKDINRYNVIDNSCVDLVRNFVEANGFLTQENSHFLDQSVSDVLPSIFSNPFLVKLQETLFSPATTKEVHQL